MAPLKAYVFGDRFLVPEFRRAVNNSFVGHKLYQQASKLYSLAIYAFENIPADRPILQFLVDKHCFEWVADLDTKYDLEYYQKLPHNFLVRVMRRYNSLYLNSGHGFEEGCYLEHTSNEEKAECAGCHVRFDNQLGDASFSQDVAEDEPF